MGVQNHRINKMPSWRSRGIIQTFDIILFILNTMMAYIVVKFKMPTSLREKTVFEPCF